MHENRKRTWRSPASTAAAAEPEAGFVLIKTVGEVRRNRNHTAMIRSLKHTPAALLLVLVGSACACVCVRPSKK